MPDSNVSILVTLKDAASKGLASLQSNFDKMKTSSEALAVGLGALAVGVSTVLFAGVKFESQMETVRQGLVTLLGSAEEADKTIARIKQEAARTPFEIAGLSTAVQLIASVTKDGDKSIDVILDVGEALAAMGKGQAELDRIIVNLQQIAAVGKAGSLDIKQFAFAGIPIYEMLQTQTGLAGQSLADFIEQGGVTFDLLTQMFDKANDEGGRFFEAYKNQTGTLTQLWSNFKDTINIGLGTFVQQIGLFDALKVAISSVTLVLPVLFEKITTLISFLTEHQEIFYVISGALIGALVPALVAVTAAMWGLISPLLIPMAIGAGVVAIFLAIKFAIEHFGEAVDFVKNIANKAWDVIYNKAINIFTSLSNFLNQTWTSIKTTAMSMFNAIGTAISFIFTVFLGGIVTILEFFGVNWKTIWEEIKSVALTIWTAISTGFAIIWNGVKLTWETIWNGIREVAITVWGAIASFLSSAWEGLKTVFSSAGIALESAWSSMWERISGTVVSVWDGIKSVITSSINWIIDKINALIGVANTLSSKVGGAKMSKIPKLAKGGIIQESGRVMVGERGPEMLDLPIGAKVTPLDKVSNATTINLYITGNTVMDNNDIIDKIGDPIMSLLKQHFAVV